MNITLTIPEAQAIADIIDREMRLHGVQAGALYGGIARQIIDGARAVTATNEDEANG